MAASVLVASSAASTVSDISPWAAVGPQASAFVFEEYDAAHRAAAAAAAAAPAPNAAAAAAAEETGSDRDDDDGDGAATAVSREGGLSTRQVRKLLKGTNIYFQAASPRDVVLVNAVESGCSVVHKEERADLIWIEAQPRTATFVRQLRHERINFLPGMRSAAQKCHFSNLIRRVAKMYPGDFPFIPRTFAMPFDAAEFKEYAEDHPKAVFVVKPDGGCGGEGIYLTDDAQNVRHPECVVQTYLQNPLTIGGLKFDFRLYVLVTSIAPLRFYLHREGLARMATQPYEPACKANFHKLNMHLTNYSLNKFSSDFVDNTAADDDAHTTKRKASTAFRQLQAEYGEDFDADDVWESITELVGVTLGVIAPHILAAVGEVPGRSNYLSRCYQLLGFDVLLDTNFKPHLLEINGHPSLQTDAPIDLFVKSQVVSPMIRMVSLDARRNRRALAGRFPFVAPSSAEAAAWEDGFTSDSGFVAFDASRGQAITARYIAPLMPMLKHFIECCGGYTGAAYDVMSSTRFARTARSLGIAGPGKIFSTPEIDLLFIKLVKKGSGGNALDFYDYLDAMLGPIGDRLSPNTVPGSLARLRDVTQQLL